MDEAQLYEALIHGTKASNSFPGETDDLEYFATHPEFQSRIAGFRDRIVRLIMDLAENADNSDQVFKLEALRGSNPGAMETFEPVSEIIDMLLENVDEALEGRGPGRGMISSSGGANSAAGAAAAAAKSELVRGVRAGLHGVITHAKVDRPQKNFEQRVDNLRKPFQPILRSKPHAVVPLPDGGMIALREDGTYPNPYEPEIQAALGAPPAWLLEPADPVEPVRKLNEVPCTWVDTPQKLQELSAALAGEAVVAIDLENHSYRSFQGFVCLMQVSTRSADFLVDTLALRSHLHILNDHFTNPNIVKVFHGADSDVVWLQRDFGLYLVSLFDTGQAARVLEYPSAGLAYALKKHVDIRVNKAYQLADWRVRPLPEDMFRYAREDTHYLLHVFDKQRNELIKEGGSDMVRMVLRRSAEVALAVYVKDTFKADGYLKLLERKNLDLNGEQLAVLAAVYRWRDTVARREDESLQYVLPDRMLVRIAQEVPPSAADLEHCCNPLPAVVQTRVTEILALVRSARESVNANVNNSNINANVSADDDDMEVDAEVNKIVAASSVPQEATDSSSGAVHMGLNSSRSSFVPIHPKGSVTFAQAAKSGLQTQQQMSSSRRSTIMRDSAQSRATPSPVLTTEQLYDTAGWQDLADPQWKAQAIVRNNTIANARPPVAAQTQAAETPRTENYRLALAAKTKIGEEQIKSGASFGALPHKTPFAAMATAMSSGARGASVSMDGAEKKTKAQAVTTAAAAADGVVSANSAGAGSKGVEAGSTSVGGPTGAEDAVIDIDTPADADALESEDIPRSMAEIYRISNRNRKRNKDKKKLKDDNSSAPRKSSRTANDDASIASGNAGNNAGTAHTISSAASDSGSISTRRRGKDEDNDMEGAGDDAIEFMRDIGWVEGVSKPVPSLVVEGAPEQPAHLAGASAEAASGAADASNNAASNASTSGAGSSGTSSSNNAKLATSSKTSSATQKRGRRNPPNSPKRRPVNANNNSNEQGSSQPRHLYGYAQAAAASGNFSYSQVTASNAGGRSNSNSTRGGRSSASSSGGGQTQQQQQYRGRTGGSGARSMSYHGK